MWTGFFGALILYVLVWHVILPFWANYQTIKWNEQSRGQHRYLYRTRPTPKPECQIWMKDCYCGKCRELEDQCEPTPPEKGPYR